MLAHVSIRVDLDLASVHLCVDSGEFVVAVNYHVWFVALFYEVGVDLKPRQEFLELTAADGVRDVNELSLGGFGLQQDL